MVGLLLITAANFKFLNLFSGLIFIDSILVYSNIKNFLAHVLVIVLLTQFYTRIKVEKTKKINISDHLLEDD
jgi:hypothetical protein